MIKKRQPVIFTLPFINLEKSKEIQTRLLKNLLLSFKILL